MHAIAPSVDPSASEPSTLIFSLPLSGAIQFGLKRSSCSGISRYSTKLSPPFPEKGQSSRVCSIVSTSLGHRLHNGSGTSGINLRRGKLSKIKKRNEKAEPSKQRLHQREDPRVPKIFSDPTEVIIFNFYQLSSVAEKMGKATRWLKAILGMKREKFILDSAYSVSGDKKETKRWSFSKSGKDSDAANKFRASSSISYAAWLKSYVAEATKGQNEQAIAVAAATAAAADAAVAAAEAAVAVVKLTSHGRGTMPRGGRERWAAVKIQTAFRGFLAWKALRALKGLVKLQAFVRGYLVRKRATAALRSMQAIVRAQATVRSHQARHSLDKENRYPLENRPRRSMENVCDTRSVFHSKRLSTSSEVGSNLDESPKIVEVDTFKTRSRFCQIHSPVMECVYNGSDYAVPQLNCQNLQNLEWHLAGNECRTPTPVKSACGDSFYEPCSELPSYMANTQSFKAKLRSLSAPKQRPDEGSKKRLALSEIIAAQNSVSAIRMHRSCSQVEDIFE